MAMAPLCGGRTGEARERVCRAKALGAVRQSQTLDHVRTGVGGGQLATGLDLHRDVESARAPGQQQLRPHGQSVAVVGGWDRRDQDRLGPGTLEPGLHSLRCTISRFGMPQHSCPMSLAMRASPSVSTSPTPRGSNGLGSRAKGLRRPYR
jgi:hypothetical protein